MRFGVLSACVLSAALVLAAVVPLLSPASAGSADGKWPSGRPRHGYGFLPGYEPPDVVEWHRRFDGRPGYSDYWYGGPQFYRGRWNGGGFGPCWTQTPIGPHWDCG